MEITFTNQTLIKPVPTNSGIITIASIEIIKGNKDSFILYCNPINSEEISEETIILPLDIHITKPLGQNVYSFVKSGLNGTDFLQVQFNNAGSKIAYLFCNKQGKKFEFKIYYEVE